MSLRAMMTLWITGKIAELDNLSNRLQFTLQTEMVSTMPRSNLKKKETKSKSKSSKNTTVRKPLNWDDDEDERDSRSKKFNDHDNRYDDRYDDYDDVEDDEDW